MLCVWVHGCDPGSIGWLAAGTIPNSLSSALLLSFSGICILLLFLFLSFFCFVFVLFFLLSLELCRCSSDLFLSSRQRTLVLDWQPRILLGMVELTLLLLCVFCIFFPFILDIKFVGRTSRGHTGGRSHRISHPPSFCGACLNFSREKDSAIPFPRRL